MKPITTGWWTGPFPAWVILAILVTGSPATAGASDLRVTTTRVARAPGSGIVQVQADFRWTNGWRTARNYDAAWLFVKYRPAPGRNWRHARLAQFTVRTSKPEVTCRRSEDRVGAFCAPAAAHRGEVSASVSIELDLSALAAGDRESSAFEVSVYGIEMVYIPGGPFTVGDPDSASAQRAAFYRSTASGGYGGTYRITSEDPIQVAPSEGNLYYRSPTQYTGDQRGPVPAAFPKGTVPFYAMKYEIRQGEYAAFLNTIDDQATFFRAPQAGPGCSEHRGTIRIEGDRYVADRPNRPANWVSWDDGTAFADWAGLRPMTEFEFTKAARGPVDPVAGDYPWGTNSKARLLRRLASDLDLVQTGDADEARLTDQTKEILGASYWWVMDLAGSVWERVVTIGHPRGRAFQGSHGDGELQDYGLATNPDWPSGDHNGGGYGYRGGGYYEWERERTRNPGEQALNPHSPVAWRPYGSWGGAPRSLAYGFRAVRTANLGIDP